MPAEGNMGPGPSAIVFAGGDRPATSALRDLPANALVLAADSGLDHARALGVAVDVVVGDLDSVDPDVLTAARLAGTTIERHPADKDSTDLELALLAARDRGAGEIVVVGGHGGRVDHFLANALLLAAPALADVHVRARFGDAEVVVVRDRADLTAAPGSLCSLLAVDGPADGVRTEGLRFPLAGETLFPTSTRGVSNELVASSAVVSLDRGLLLAILPEFRKDS
jgi:thiamine pyrophosphokinase